MTGPRRRSGESSFRLTVDSRDLDRASDALREIKGGIEKATMRALNRSSMGARAEAVRQARSGYHVQASRVRETLTVRKASRGRLQASVTSKGHPLPLSRFRLSPKTVPKQSGIRVRSRRKVKASVMRSTSPVKFDRAFIARFRSGHVGVFQRIGKEKTRTGHSRLRELHSLSVPQMIGHQNAAKAVGEIARERLVRELDHQVDRIRKGAR